MNDDAIYHSSGRFTLDPRQALEKLAGKALVDADSGTLKLVQAFVRLGAHRLNVSLTSKSWCFTPEVERGFDLEKLRRLFDQASLSGQVSPEAELVRALVYLLPARLHSASWGQHRLLGEATGKEGQLVLSFHPPAPTFPKGLWSKRLVHCPMAVLLEGQPLHQRPLGEKKLFVFPKRADSSKTFPVPDGGLRWMWEATTRRWSTQVPPRFQVPLACWLTPRISEQAATYPVQAGVMLEPIFHQSHPPEILSVVDAEGLSTDLSGLRIVQDEAWRQRLEELGGDLPQLASVLGAARSTDANAPAPAPIAAAITILLSIGIIVFMLLLWLTGQLPLGVAATFALVTPALWCLGHWIQQSEATSSEKAIEDRFKNAKL